MAVAVAVGWVAVGVAVAVAVGVTGVLPQKHCVRVMTSLLCCIQLMCASPCLCMQEQSYSVGPQISCRRLQG